MTQRAVGDAFNAVTEHHATQHRQRYAERQCQQWRHTPSEQRGQRGKRQHRAYHHHFAMREIDQAEYAIHHGVAQRDQRIHAALHKTVNDLL